MGQPSAFPRVQLAQDAFPWVAVLVARLASRKVSRQLGELGGHLCGFAEEIAQFSEGHKRDLERDGRIARVLSLVEDAISPTQAPPRLESEDGRHHLDTDYPLLNAVATSRRAYSEGRLEATSVLSSLESKIRKALIKGATNYLAISRAFQECSCISNADFYDDETPGNTNEACSGDLPGYAKQAKALHSILSTYAVCTCPGHSTKEQHLARLRLRPVHNMPKDNLIPFEMLFSASPTPIKSPSLEWQDVIVLVPTKRQAQQRGVHWRAADGSGQQRSLGDSNSQPGDDDGESEAVQNLCTYISSRCGSKLYFKVLKQSLRVFRHPQEDMAQRREAQAKGLHLGEMLDRFHMRHGMRPVLAYTLAKAVWHYYDSDWMNVSMTDNSIYFMGETDGEGTGYFCKPYLSTQLQTGTGESPEYRGAIGMMHRYPRVLALGILLIEIATGQRVELEGHPDQWTPKEANEQLIKLRQFLFNGSFQEDCGYPRYKTAVAKCLDPMLFKDAPSNPKKPKENLETRRAILYDEVVDPLRQLLEGTGLDAEFEKMETIALRPKHGDNVGRPVDQVHRPVDNSRSTDIGQPASRVPRADPWLKELALLNQMLKRRKKQTSLKKSSLRIAILDTGYDANAPTFDLPSKSRRIKKWKDFVADSPTAVDVSGHGTHLLTLLLQLNITADIYVARIAENTDTLHEAEDSIAEAIRTAAMDWDVDFISMSFGFPRHVQKVRDAISDAVHHKKGAVTFFAAANNEGFNSREMFPANLGEHVISIRGTDRSGAFAPKFNPPMSSDEPMFGTLGCDVCSDWIGGLSSVPMSGCSVATPVAVTIAVMLLDYAASMPSDFGSEDLRLMRTRRGLLEMFKEIGVHSGDGRYYLAPFALFKLTEDVRVAKMKSAIGRHPERW